MERGVLMNGLGILVKASRTFYLILFSRMLGAEGFGIYLLAFALQEFISKFAILGLNWGAKQVVGNLRSHGKIASIRPTVVRILCITLLFSSCVALGMAGAADWIASLLGQETVAAPLRIFAVGFPFLCGMYVLVYSFRPALNMKYEMYVTSIFEPMTVLVIGVIILQQSRTVEMLAYAHVAASMVGFLAAVYYFNRIYPSINRGSRAEIDWGMLFHGSAGMGGMELLGNLQGKVDLLFLALYFPPQVIGVYGAATQIVSLLRKAKAAFDPILMPIAQGLFLSGEKHRLQGEVTRAVSWAMYIGLLLMGLIILLPDQLLGLFGKEFSGEIYGRVLVILAVGQFFYMSMGLCEGILAITGHAYVTLVSAVLLLLTEVLLLLALIPVWGLLGAAMAASLPFIGVTVWRMVQCKGLMGIDMVSRAHLKLITVWAGCVALALLLSVLVSHENKINLVVSVSVFAAVHFAVSWRFQSASTT